MEVPKGASRADIERILCEEEASKLTETELEFAEICQQNLTDAQKKATSEWDLITVVRGYQSFKPRDVETTKAMDNIWKFRTEIGADKFLTGEDVVPPEVSDMFHKMWPDKVYGVDKHGHAMMMLTLKDINVEEISKLDQSMIEKLVAQKLTAFTAYREKLSKESGVQRYKYSLCVDVDGAGVMGLVSGEKKKLLQRFFNIGGDYFPETVWRIYVVNTPFVFRAAWAVAKAFVHPITIAKVNLFPTHAKCVPVLEEDGWDKTQLPALFGGSHEGSSLKEVIDQVIASKLGADLEEKANVE